MSCIELVVELGNEYHARCDYCGRTEGEDWRKGEYKLYCSADCQNADRIPGWFCFLFIFGSLTVYGLITNAHTYVLLPLIACGFFTFFSLIQIVRGIQARERISRRYDS